MSELHYLSLAEAGRQIRAGALSPVKLTEALLARIGTLDGKLDSFLKLLPDQALATAEAAQKEVAAGGYRGPMHGIPYALKDIIDVAGVETTGHSKLHMGNVAAADSVVTAKIRAAGGVLVGKLATHEFALGGPSFDLPWPPARNPWKPTHFTGGSSSGSGAAVAAGFVPAALGTDTGGSVRHPATHCGIVGMKATYGLVSRRGVLPLSFALDHIGPMTRTVEDNALLLNVLAGHDPKDPASVQRPPEDYARLLGQGVKGLRIGVIRHFHETDMQADPEVATAIDDAIAVLRDLGAEVREVSTAPLQRYAAVNRTILYTEAYAIHEKWLREKPQDYGQHCRSRMVIGGFLKASDYMRAVRARAVLAHDFAAMMADLDLAVSVSSHDPAASLDDPAEIGRRAERQARTVSNVTGNPALSIPVGFTGGGLPIGMQLIGHPWQEALIYRAADAYEKATRWVDRHPPID